MNLFIKTSSSFYVFISPNSLLVPSSILKDASLEKYFPSQNISGHESPIQTSSYLLEIRGKSLARHKVLLYDRVNVQHIYEISKSIYQGTM